MSEFTYLPCFILTDADPFGIEIACTYAFGSVLAGQESDGMAIPFLHWLGIHIEDFINFGHTDLHQDTLLNFTKEDNLKI